MAVERAAGEVMEEGVKGEGVESSKGGGGGGGKAGGVAETAFGRGGGRMGAVEKRCCCKHFGLADRTGRAGRKALVMTELALFGCRAVGLTEVTSACKRAWHDGEASTKGR